ncbi:cell division protein ZapA [Dethiobacter alkaliphilus]|uniref:Cell division protein ZapA n=1 Tax=Dethiobacter alkaliphilus AHT 1 TaxID=555088 RepID=C0GJM2_DETAL|nr:cell division protein ZapA [Dethiobacter alkaliphilus]EEG76444.1 protein of unknown function DUF710 [Dethiobacter alkaliphilus AHT 1]
MTHDDNKARVNVKIYGEEYVMRGPNTPEHMLSIAHYVDEKMKEIGQANTRLGINKVAVLTSLNLADELFRARKELQEMKARMEQKNRQEHRNRR